MSGTAQPGLAATTAICADKNSRWLSYASPSMRGFKESQTVRGRFRTSASKWSNCEAESRCTTPFLGGPTAISPSITPKHTSFQSNISIYRHPQAQQLLLQIQQLQRSAKAPDAAARLVFTFPVGIHISKKPKPPQRNLIVGQKVLLCISSREPVLFQLNRRLPPT